MYVEIKKYIFIQTDSICFTIVCCNFIYFQECTQFDQTIQYCETHIYKYIYLEIYPFTTGATSIGVLWVSINTTNDIICAHRSTDIEN